MDVFPKQAVEENVLIRGSKSKIEVTAHYILPSAESGNIYFPTLSSILIDESNLILFKIKNIYTVLFFSE